jgi:serine protease inhibitor
MKKKQPLIFIFVICILLVFPGCSVISPSIQPTTVTTSPTSNAIVQAANLMVDVQAAAWPQTPDLPDSQAIEAVNHFAEGLFLTSAANSSNIMVSPVSVFLALAMTVNGADGETKEAMMDVLADNGLSVEQVNKLCRNYITLLTKSGGKTNVSIANSIWFADNFRPYQPFLQTNADFFKAGASKLDFSDKKSKDIINTWVKEKTHGLIKEIIDKISPSTVMFLINTVYFKSDWQTPFAKAETRKQIFHAPSGDVETEFMHRTDKMSYFTGDGVKGVALPYDDVQFSYFAFLPEDKTSPRQWLAKQDKDTLIATISGLMAQKANFTVDLTLPKYEAEYEDSLLNELTTLGMGIAFDPSGADFSLLNEQRSHGLYISEVKHKTFIRVDEKGTEAAAATSVAIDESAILADVQLVFDRPFVYGIMDMKTGTPLFIGILENPAP